MDTAEQIVTVESGRAWGEMVGAAHKAMTDGGMSKKHADEMVRAKFAPAWVSVPYDDE